MIINGLIVKLIFFIILTSIIFAMNTLLACCWGKNSVDVEPSSRPAPIRMATAHVSAVVYSEDKLTGAVLRRPLEVLEPCSLVCTRDKLFIQSIDDSNCTVTVYDPMTLRRITKIEDKFRFFGDNNWQFADDIFCGPNQQFLFQKCYHMLRHSPARQLRRFNVTDLEEKPTEFEFDASELLLPSKCGQFVLMTDSIFERSRAERIFDRSGVTLLRVPHTVRSMFPLSDASAEVPTDVNDSYSMICSTLHNIIIIDRVREQIIRFDSSGIESIKTHGRPSDIEFNHDQSRFFVSYYEQNRIDIFNSLNLREVPVTLHTSNPVISLAFGIRGKYLAAGCINGISIIDTLCPGAESIIVPTKSDTSYCLVFRPDEAQLFAAFPCEHKVRVIDLAYSKLSIDEGATAL